MCITIKFFVIDLNTFYYWALKKALTGIEDLVILEYIWDKIISITNYEKLNVYFKNWVVPTRHFWMKFCVVSDVDI
jgi:hypothetical protein